VTLTPGSTCSELGGQDDDLSSWQASVGECQLEWSGTMHLCQHRAGDLLPVDVPRHGSRGWPMRGCALVDPLGIGAMCRPGLL
jgi:hypothetical protein